jgi:NADPH:quinone reductase-like Zn-dependent oxidoreductase
MGTTNVWQHDARAGMSTATMHAIVQRAYGPPEGLELREIERPVLGPGEVLVRVHAAGIDQGVWHLLAGRPLVVRLAGYGLRAPKTPVPGLDVAGTVERVSAGATGVTVGDEVFGTCGGSFAEYARARPDRLARKPANLSFAEAAAVPTSGYAALQAVRDQGRVQPGQRVLVIGAGGGVGTFAVQIAKAYGAEVTGVASTAKTDLVRSIGADHVIDYTREDFAATRQPFDVILDIAGRRKLAHLRRALAPDGTLVIVGGEGGGTLLGGVDRQLRAAILSRFVRQRLGSWISSERAEDLEELRRLLAAGTIRPVVDRAFPLVDVPDAIRYLRAGRVRGKAVIKLHHDGEGR